MAIDTAEKRQNLTGVGRLYLRSQFPAAAKDAEWRQAAGLSYSGNAVGAGGGPAVTVKDYLIRARRRGRR